MSQESRLDPGPVGTGHEDAAKRGQKIDWHLDPVNRRRAQAGWWSAVPYLDPGSGDHKVIWEINRHQHWIGLGRAFWLTADGSAKARFTAELESWLAANLPLAGINWASMLELAFRSLSWIWALHMFVSWPGAEEATTPASGRAAEPPWTVDLLLGVDRQLRHIARNLSCYFSPNTHLTGEALALYAGGLALPELAGSRQWVETGRRILVAESTRQVLPDGGHAERSTCYHRYSLDFYLMALTLARLNGDLEAEPAFASAVAGQARFARALADDRAMLPLIGDEDGGSLLPTWGSSRQDVSTSLAWASLLLGEPSPPGVMPEELMWATGSLGPEIRPRGGRHQGTPRAGCQTGLPRSACFAATGFYVSNKGRGDHLVISAAPHGFLSGGHAHADALSVVLSIAGKPFAIDTGSGTYTVDPALRDRLRSSAAHNTLTLDGRSQSEPGGPFHWKRRAAAAPGRWYSNGAFDYFEGSEDAYTPAAHRRAVFSSEGERWYVLDWIGSTAEHVGDVFWHLDPSWQAEIVRPGVVRCTHGDGTTAWLLTTARTVDLFHGDDESGLGWHSPVYGSVLPCWSVRFRENLVAGRPAILSAVLVAEPWERQAELELACLEATASDCDPGRRHPCPFASISRRASETEVFVAIGGWQGTLAERSGAIWAIADNVAGMRTRADLQGDARLVHARFDTAGRFAACSMVEGSSIRSGDAGRFALSASGPVTDLSIRLDGADLAVFTSHGGFEAKVAGEFVRAVRRVSVNGSETSWVRDGSTMTFEVNDRSGRAEEPDAGVQREPERILEHAAQD